MQAIKKADWKMLFAPSFWRWVPVGMTFGVWCFVGGMALHSCTAEPAPAKELTKMEAMEQAADLEVLKVERAYEAMSDEEKMEGVVYE